MKRTIAFLVVFCLCVGLCSCAQKPNVTETTQEPINEATIEQPEETTEPTVVEPEVWTITMTVDEFGDVTDDSELVMQTSFNGTFSNSATTDGKLDGIAYTLYNEDNDRCYFGFKLFEYGDNPVICSGYDEIILKAKVGDEIVEYDEVVANFIEQGTLFIGVSMDWINYDGNQFIDALYNGNDVRCIFYINNSEYKFTVESGNFKTLYDLPNVGKVQLPGAFCGEWEYSSGDPTVFSRIVSDGANIVETSNLIIELPEETTTYGNLIPIVIKDTENDLTYNVDINFALDYAVDATSLNKTNGYVQTQTIEISEDKTLVFTVNYYQDVGIATGDEWRAKLYDESATIAVCEFKRIGS